MGTIELNNKVTELKELKQYAKEIEAEITGLEDEIKREMEARGEEEMTVGVFTVRYKTVESSRFDSKRFKLDHADLYKEYQKKTVTKRFTC